MAGMWDTLGFFEREAYKRFFFDRFVSFICRTPTTERGLDRIDRGI
jgi:hypothetical protein